MGSIYGVKIPKNNPSLINRIRNSRQVIPQLLTSVVPGTRIDCRSEPRNMPFPGDPGMDKFECWLKDLHLPRVIIPQTPNTPRLTAGVNNVLPWEACSFCLTPSLVTTRMGLHQKHLGRIIFLSNIFNQGCKPLGRCTTAILGDNIHDDWLCVFGSESPSTIYILMLGPLGLPLATSWVPPWALSVSLMKPTSGLGSNACIFFPPIGTSLCTVFLSEADFRNSW